MELGCGWKPTQERQTVGFGWGFWFQVACSLRKGYLKKCCERWIAAEHGIGLYSGLTKIRTRRRAADSTHVTARRANAVLI
ncbi:hypothetical protein ELB75_09255 [Eikenella corrodens]|uniref:Uncharacterized protein n=1 Tax=Eikenella corrodens TaxID=539 RepID=A0A3S9SMW2_EIKCO|nr:hypothetical protein ELB75_09255 [Eikenella corrodens]